MIFTFPLQGDHQRHLKPCKWRIRCIRCMCRVCCICCVRYMYTTSMLYMLETPSCRDSAMTPVSCARPQHGALFVAIGHDLLGICFSLYLALRIFTFLLQGDPGVISSRIYGAYAVYFVYAVDAVYAVYAVYAVRATPLKLQKNKGVPKVMFFFITCFKNLHFLFQGDPGVILSRVYGVYTV